MKKRILSFLMALCMALALLPATALAESTYKYKLHAVVTEPVDGQKPSTEATDTNNKKSESNPKITPPIVITRVEWSGELDANGCFKAGVAYTVTVTEQINPECSSRFIFKSEASVNGKTANVISLSEDARTITASYTFPVLRSAAQIAQDEADKEAEKQGKQDAKDQKEHEAELARRFSQAEADAQCPKLKPITIVVSEDNQDMDYINSGGSFAAGLEVLEVFNWLSTNYHTLDGDVVISKDSPWLGGVYGEHFDYFRIDRIVYDLYRKDDFSVIKYYTAKELWLSPECDIQGILDGIGRETKHHGFKTYDYTVFIPDSVYPNGPTYKTALPPGCRVMLYSDSDVYAAAEKGKEAAREWCFNHSYTAKIEQRDRIYLMDTCQNHRLYYYSCSKCGKCEYNPNHYFVYTDAAHANIGIIFTEFDGKYSEHQYEAYTVSDEHFLGLNVQGDRVYLKACEWCGKDQKQVDLATTHDYYKNVMGMDDSDPSYYQLYMEKVKKSWSPGGTAYEMRMKATPGDDYLDGFAVVADKFVTAKTSGWASQSVQVASNDNLIDRALLGDDYTKTVTRLQFASIAVKMAEEMLGKSITPAPSGTFTDTDSEYVRKAVTAGITGGVGDGRFDPNGALNRQQMATFLYRALQYVKANSDTEYTVWDSKLGSYTDAGQLDSWAKEPMAFMNGLGLITGTSDTTLSPNNSCTIEQALIVADRSLDAGVIGWYQYVGADSDSPAAYNYPGYGNINHGDRIWFTSADGTCKDTHGIECSVVVKNNNYYAIKDR